jgi:hypothetical protein
MKPKARFGVYHAPHKGALAFDGQIEEFSEVETGVPQGSPISPILFLIYIRDLFQNLEDVYPLSYIDDIALAISSTSWKKNARILQREVGKLTRTGDSQAIQFDLAKTELLHFSKSAKDHPTYRRGNPTGAERGKVARNLVRPSSQL